MPTNSNELNLPLRDTMDMLDVIRKLYDENADPAELERGLDEERRAELRRLVEAKEAVDALPPRRPSAASLKAVTASAGKAPARNRGRLSLILGPRFIQHFAAAAAVIVAVGIGYLTIKSPDLNVESVDTELTDEGMSQDRPIGQGVVGGRFEAEEVASNLPSRSNIESTPAAALLSEVDAVVESHLLNDSVKSRRAAQPDDYSYAAGADLVGAVDTAGHDTMAWDDKLKFQTFYWQVQALGERSPDDDWDEAVPLEGSFRNLEGAKRDPAWFEAKSEK